MVAKRPGIAAVENDDDISGARCVRELIDPGTAHRGGEQIRAFCVLHAQMQSTGQIELAVPAEVEEQNIVSVCCSEEPAQRAHHSISGRLGQQLDKATAKPGAETVKLDPRGIKTVYLHNEYCDNDVSASS